MGLFKTFGRLETGSFFGSKKTEHRLEPDAGTLMIVAGPCGSGKSSILQAAYKESLPLFGADYCLALENLAKTKLMFNILISRKLFERSRSFRPGMSSR